MSNKLLGILKNYFIWTWIDLILIIVSSLILAIGHSVFHIHWLPLGILWALVFIKCFSFLRSSSITAANVNNHFSWKFIQSLPLSKKELVLLISTIEVLGKIPLLYTFLISYSFLRSNEFFEFIKDLNLMKFTANYLLISLIMALASIISLVNYPRSEFFRKNNKWVVTFFQNFLLMAVIIIYIFIAMFYLQSYFDRDLIVGLGLAVEKIINYSTTWYFPPLLIIMNIFLYKTALNIWANEKAVPIKVLKEYEHPWRKVVICCVLLIAPCTFLDFQTPFLYQGSLLNKAVYEKNYSEVEKLIGKNYKINEANSYGFTPMLIAIDEGDLNAIIFLENHGANYEGGLKNLIKRYKSYNALLIALLGRKPEIVEHLLKRGFDLNKEVSNMTYFPIHFAAARCDSKMLDFIIGKGVDINVQNRNEETPLFVAIRRGCLSTFITLREKGAKLNLVNKDGKKAIDYLNDKDNSELKYFVEKYMRAPASLK